MNEKQKKARIRTIRDALAIIKSMDSETAITYNFIRKLCNEKAITSLWAGKKILINLDELLSYLNIEAE